MSACDRFSVTPSLVHAVIKVESGYRADAVSRAGAIGLMQLMPSTAEWCAKKVGAEFEKADLFDPKCNITLGVYYLSYLLNRFNDEETVIAAYNAGEGNVMLWKAQKLTEIPFPETRRYVERVINAQRIYQFLGIQ